MSYYYEIIRVCVCVRVLTNVCAMSISSMHAMLVFDDKHVGLCGLCETVVLL